MPGPDRLQCALVQEILRRKILKLKQGILSAILSGMLVVGLSACEKEGPAEQAGKAMDEAASDVTEKAEETKEAVEGAMKE